MAKDVVPLQCVSTQFAFRAAAHPETLAVVDGDCCLTYGELARRVRVLAAELQRRGVAVEDSVGLLLDRSPELYLGLLAVHLCGACYVPLDPAWPTQRHLFIATETECKVVLTVSSQVPPADLLAETILLDQFDWSQADRATGFPPPDLNRLAYILYTSGSTGVPKGVEIEHGSLANFVAWQNGTFPHLRNHRVSQAARPGFDASGSEIWPALCSGSTLYVIPAELLRNSAALAAWLTEQKINECFLPTPLAELLLEQGLPNGSHLRVLRTGGERLTRKPPADFPAILVNEYGPTECSIVSTYAVFYPGDDPLPPPDIGMPINRCKIYVMNDRLQMLPDGEVGEICISGIGLARGYHRRPDLDAVAFVANPLQPEERLYRTGDLGIRQQNGRFDYVGRMDFQVKLHGQRIELGEIETVIAAHPEVNKCVAQIRGSPGGAKRLVVYVTVRQRSSTITTELLSLARERLPEYMVPTAVVILDAFLLTAYGKIDRQALPEPTVTRKDWRAPEDKYARKIAALWQEQLQCPPPGLDDHFFHLGGDSLYAMVLAVRLGNEFDFAATATLLFQYPVLANLAAFVKKNTGTGVSTGLKCDIDDAARRRFPVTSYQLSQWRLQQASGCGNMNNIVELIHLEGPLEPSLLERVLANIVAENQSLRSSFHWDGKQLWQSTADAVGAKLPLHDWSDEDQSCQAKKTAARIEEHRRHCFDQSKPPLFRAELFRIADQRYELLLTIDHLIFDGWSNALFLSRLRDCYLGLSAGQAIVGPGADAPDYADFAYCHHRQLASGAFRKGLAAWREMLADFHPMPELPCERIKPLDDRYAAGRYEFLIPEKLCTRLKNYALENGTTLFTLLQAVLQLQLHKYTGVTDIVTGTAFANRKLRGSEGIVGMFINSLPLRQRFQSTGSFNDFIADFQKTVRLCFEYSDVPLDLIPTDHAWAGRRNPLFQVSLLLQNLPWPENSAEKLRVSYDELGNAIAKTDLTLFMEERHGVLDCQVEYREAIFSRQTVAEFCAAYQVFAEILLDSPTVPIAALSCPSPAGSRPGIYIVGETGLLPACGEILKAKGFYIHGVFSLDPAVRAWALGHRIPCYHPETKEFASVLRRIPFDYFFSIVNASLLREDILSLPRKMAINYHDSPLPSYAGLNACSWAVINGERRYGISWHEMTPEVDAGPICKQRLFEISPATTAMQLSLQCSEACVAALTELAAELIAGKLETTPQDSRRHSCYRASDRPWAGAMLDWSCAAEGLLALVRGLDLGPYDNELACPKFFHHGRLVLVNKASLASVTGPGNMPRPGTVTTVAEEGITVSVQDGLILLEGLSDSFGKDLGTEDFQVGDDLSCPAEYDLNVLDQAYVAAAHNEKYWVGMLSALETMDIPLHNWEPVEAADTDVLLPDRPGMDTVLLFSLFLARLTGSERLYLPLRLSDEPLATIPADFLLDYLPLRIDVSYNRGARENMAEMAATLAICRQRRHCPGDICARRKKLRYFSHRAPALWCDNAGRVHLRHCDTVSGARLLQLFTVFCDNLEKRPDAPLKTIDLLSADAFQQEVFVWNRTKRSYRLNTSYAALWTEQLAGFADRVAVVAGECSLTYRELDQYSSRLAQLLRAHGAAAGDTIGLCAVRSPELAAALLGIFKAGCAYLALEPGQFPPERRRLMLKNGEVAILLFYDPESSPEDYPDSLDLIDLSTKTTQEALAAYPDSFPLPVSNGDENAYLMFTSGSTGTPKGVMVSQRNLLNHNQAVIEAFDLRREDRMLQFGSLSFDLSVEEIFPILLVGGALIFRPGRRVPPSPAELLAFARQEQISIFDLPTAYWHILATMLPVEKLPPALRLVVIGGEYASAEHLRHWRASAPKVRLLNTYGPTETTVIATISEDTTTIGRPIGNVRIYILDQFMRPCPPACIGDIYIGGDGVSKGYVNDLERTCRVFVSDPFVPGERLYRSGDLGSFSPTGEIIYLGRADRQVKIQGIRVELTSVEATLRNLPGIDDAVVEVYENALGMDRLAAYVTATGPAPDSEQIRKKLAEILPAAMVPATVTLLSEWPMTSIGKVDRKALPIPELPTEPEEDSQPESFLQIQLLLIFKRLLGLNSVSLNRRFFDLGGDSLSALNLCLEVEHICGYKLGMEELYRSPSIKELAQELSERSETARPWQSLVPLANNGKERPLYLIHTTSSNVHGYVNLAGLIANRPVYAFQAYGLGPENEPHRTIPEMAAYYVKILREQQPAGPYYLSGWCFGGFIAYEMACLLREMGAEVGFLGLIETWGRPAKSPALFCRKLWNFCRWGAEGWLDYLNIRWHSLIGENSNLSGYITAKGTSQPEQQKIALLNELYSINMQAAQDYVMRHYYGEIELVCTRKVDIKGLLPSPDRYWTGLVDRIHWYIIDEASHAAILKPPVVDKVADRFNTVLKTADQRYD